jgi:ubiquinone/menaquinone biosynthesis C-methylase UbiE
MAITRLARPALDDTRVAFDGVAPAYDRSNADNPVLRAMRQRVVRALTARVPSGARILDLGCGPGTDAVALAQAGYEVTALDWSPAMIAEARTRARDARVRDRVEWHRLGIHELDQLPPGLYDAALSNFGPLNCVPDLAAAARLVAARLRPGGVLVASVIGRVCPWEIALYLVRGDRARARVRFTTDFVPVPLDGRTVWMKYYAPAAFERVFRNAGFRPAVRRGLGLCAPPPYLQAFAKRHPRLVDRLHAADDWLAGWPVLRGWGDHFLAVLVRP